MVQWVSVAFIEWVSVCDVIEWASVCGGHRVHLCLQWSLSGYVYLAVIEWVNVCDGHRVGECLW